MNEDEPGSSPDVESRREFCGRACRLLSLAAASGVAAAVASCGGGSGGPGSPSGQGLPLVQGTTSGSEVTVAVDSASPLASVGGAALVQTGGQPLLVSQTAQGVFKALNAICTHQTCIITGHASSLYICPCHGSEFDMNGNVVSGPAQVSLRSFPTQFAAGVLTIHV